MSVSDVRTNLQTRPFIGQSYPLIPEKFYNPNPSRNALGLFGGNEVSQISGNIVDLESDLFGITRDVSRAPQFKYQPSCALGGAQSCADWPKSFQFQERSTGRVVTVDTRPRHLPTTQYVSMPGVPTPSPFAQEVHGAPWRF